ncbi:MAG: hypothetical protein EOP48_04950 [Sphingobacteriales bacterium]|nr:MAG: hypothetical protein EOP48_04950 [Sphingobacteriales bacterium]
MSFKTNFRYIGMTIFVFSLPIVFFIVLLFVFHNKTGEWQWADTASKSAVFFVLISLMTVPGFLLHYKYYKHDKGKSLRFRPTYFELGYRYQTTKVYFKDIQKVERRYVAWNRRNPWSDYGYIKVFLTSSETVSFTCLLSDDLSSAAFFRNKNVAVEEDEILFPWVN